MNKMGGAALLLVLWLIVLLTALIGAFALTARVEALQGKVLSGGTQAQELARAGIEYALVRLADPDPSTQWIADGRKYNWKFAGAEVQVSIVDESGKLDLNQAQAPLLSALLQAAGEPRELAEQTAAAIIDWRDADPLTQLNGGAEDPQYAAVGLPYGAKDAPFESVAEVEQVLGMTPTLYALLEPNLTIYSGRTEPNPLYAPGLVLTAMGLDAGQVLAQRSNALPLGTGSPLVGTGTGTYSIDSHARLNGRNATLRTTIRAGSGRAPGSAYSVLRWQEGTASQ